MQHKFQEGDKKPETSGRKKGTPNKYTNIKKAFIEAFSKIGEKDENGEFKTGVEGLILWANKSANNRALYYAWMTKLFPLAFTGGEDKDGEPLPIKLIMERNGTNPREPGKVETIPAVQPSSPSD